MLLYSCLMAEPEPRARGASSAGQRQQGLRERGKARRRSAIIRAAFELFAERGYHATTVADIAEKAEVAPRTVAMYFPTKQDIALSRFSAGIASLHEAMTSRRPGESTTTVLRRWLLTDQPGLEDPELTRLARRMFAANPELAALRQAQLASAIRDGAAMIAADTGRDPDTIGPRLASAAAAAVVLEVADIEPGADREEAVAAAMRFITAGLETL
jgi:AcrR family transcriptional regulator